MRTISRLRLEWWSPAQRSPIFLTSSLEFLTKKYSISAWNLSLGGSLSVPATGVKICEWWSLPAWSLARGDSGVPSVHVLNKAMSRSNTVLWSSMNVTLTSLSAFTARYRSWKERGWVEKPSRPATSSLTLYPFCIPRRTCCNSSRYC